MISIRKYLDLIPGPRRLRPQTDETQFFEAVSCYRQTILVVGNSAATAYPATGADLSRELLGLERRLATESTASVLRQTQMQANARIQEWSSRSAQHLKAKADEVKSILVTFADAAQSMGNSTQADVHQFRELASSLESLSTIDDLASLRTALVRAVSELRGSVEAIYLENKQMVDQLQGKVSTYEQRLKSMEELAFRDEATSVANRRAVEERHRWLVGDQQPFCILMVDLNNFKQVNDCYGHAAGDDLLRQFAAELLRNTRSTDLVGRWGGDEFIVLLQCDRANAEARIAQIRQWVFGFYEIEGSTDGRKQRVQVHNPKVGSSILPAATRQAIVFQRLPILRRRPSPSGLQLS